MGLDFFVIRHETREKKMNQCLLRFGPSFSL